jgi:hypothetical protein
MTSCFHSELVGILRDLMIHMVMVDSNPLYTLEEIINATTSLRYRLLLCAPTRPAISQSNILSEACRIGVLIYLRPAICCQVSYRYLLGQLKSCLEDIKIHTDMERCEVAELVLWLTFIGGATALDGPDRAWFVAWLSKTAGTIQIYSWDDVRSVLGKFLRIEKIHERTLLTLWKEALGKRNSVEGSKKE